MSYIDDQTTRHVGVVLGYGAHLDPAIAMARSLTEAAQGRAIYVGGARDDMFRHHYLNLKKADSESAITFLEGLPAVVDARQLTSAAATSFEGDALIVIDRLKAVGLDRVIVFDLTFPGFDVSVVRVIVPGLEGYMFDYYTPGPRARRFAGIDRPS
jgi:ribosomal protein S12 methylthiotransferase accessory factor